MHGNPQHGPVRLAGVEAQPMTALTFIAGLCVGFVLGALVMALMVVSGRESRREEARGE